MPERTEYLFDIKEFYLNILDFERGEITIGFTMICLFHLFLFLCLYTRELEFKTQQNVSVGIPERFCSKCRLYL